MSKGKSYTVDVLQNLDNCIENELKNHIMNNQLTLTDFIDAWLELFKKNALKVASYGRLLTSKKGGACSLYQIEQNWRKSKASFLRLYFHFDLFTMSFCIQTHINKIL